MTKHTAYNNLYNEGGEGYNPYPKHVETPEPLIWQLRGKRDRILHIMESVSTADARYAQLEAEKEAIEVKIKIEEAK